MDSNKATPQEIYEVLEQQKKLQDIRARLVGVLEKVNQTMNSITVENLELTSSQIESFDDSIDQKPNIPQNPAQDLMNLQRAEEINQQLVDLELKFSHFEASDESEIDL